LLRGNGLIGRETDIFRKTIKYSLTLLGMVVVIVLVEAWVVPGVIPVDPGAGIEHLAFYVIRQRMRLPM